MSRSKLILGAVSLLGVLVLCTAGYFFLSRQIIQYRQTQFFLGTVVRIDICAARKEQKKVLEGFDRAWERVRIIDARLTAYAANNDVAKINASYPHSVKVNAEVANIIRVAKDYCQKTKGAFDITVAPLMDLWKTAQAQQRWPSEDLVSIVQAAVGCDNVDVLGGDYIKLLHSQTKIDLGGIGQGYAADEVARILHQQGFKDFLVDMGGEIVAQGHNAAGRLWRVGIKDPNKPRELIRVITLSGQAVSTSGNYEKYYEISGKKYSHVINPVSGYPQEEITSVTVVAQNATQADVLSTAICVLGYEKGLQLLSLLAPDAGVLIAEKDIAGHLKFYQNHAFEAIVTNSP